MAIYTLRNGMQHSLTDASTRSDSADKLTTGVSVKITDAFGNIGTATEFDGSTDVTLTLASGIVMNTVVATEALILPENTGGPANSIFIYKPS